jgi:hypothetical protein
LLLSFSSFPLSLAPSFLFLALLYYCREYLQMWTDCWGEEEDGEEEEDVHPYDGKEDSKRGGHK